ncbi:FUSC family protein [Trinickia terrae]|uniref:FUSC family protein n=1 Tax=Trinickia terrae TaxID=2571161 RepID=A0A4U1HYW7_9BURK|nr:FUSC family protein [Trinickia terrae]TKC86283.1 FUSC family protein [Trinickia terrae]
MPSLHRLRAATNATMQALARRRPAWLVYFSIEEASLSEGLRAAFAATAMLLLGKWLNIPLFAWAAIGAFWTCLADAAETPRRRFASMAGFAVLSTLCGGISAFAAGAGTPYALAAVLVFSSLAGLTTIWSAAAYQVAILAATACIVLVAKPQHHFAAAAPLLSIYFGGCLFATVLSFTVWRIHPFAPSRLALRVAYARLAELARDCARLIEASDAGAHDWARHATEIRAQARAAIEAATQSLLGMPQARIDGSKTYRNLSFAAADAERVFGYLIAISNAGEYAHYGAQRQTRAARCLIAMAGVLRRIGEQLEEPSTDYPASLRKRLLALSLRLAAPAEQKLSLPPLPAGHGGATALSEEEPWPVVLGRTLLHGWERLKQNASFESPGVRHAVRLAAATTAAYATVTLLNLPLGYWATMAALLVLQPSSGTTWRRGLERAAGSAAGAVIAVVIGLLVHTPLAISLVVFPLICLTVALRRVSYSLYALFLTPSFVLVADFATPASEFGYAISRLENNLLGCVFALLAAYLLWPSRDSGDLRRAVADAVRSNLAYLIAALDATPATFDACESARRMAGLASNHAEDLLRLARLEPLRRTDGLRSAQTTLELLRRIAGTTTRLRMSARTRALNQALGDWIGAANADIERGLAGTPPSTAFVPFPDANLRPVEAAMVSEVAQLWHLVIQDHTGAGWNSGLKPGAA